MLGDQQARKRITILAGVIDPDHQEEIGLSLHNEVREEYVWHSGDLIGCLLILLCSVSTANGQMRHPQDVIIRDSYPSWITTRVHLSDRPPRPEEVLD